LSVGRKYRRAFVAPGSELPRIATFPRHAPQISAVGKNYLCLAEGGRVRQQRRFLRGSRYSRAHQRQQSTAYHRHSNAHVPSKEIVPIRICLPNPKKYCGQASWSAAALLPPFLAIHGCTFPRTQHLSARKKKTARSDPLHRFTR